MFFCITRTHIPFAFSGESKRAMAQVNGVRFVGFKWMWMMWKCGNSLHEVFLEKPCGNSFIVHFGSVKRTVPW